MKKTINGKTKDREPNVREFITTDWDCYSGAESFPDGSPLIVDDLPVTIIADTNGIEVNSEHFTLQVSNTTHPQVIKPFWNQELARLCLLNLAKTWSRMTIEEIKSYCEQHGFVKVL